MSSSIPFISNRYYNSSSRYIPNFAQVQTKWLKAVMGGKGSSKSQADCNWSSELSCFIGYIFYTEHNVIGLVSNRTLWNTKELSQIRLCFLKLYHYIFRICGNSIEALIRHIPASGNPGHHGSMTV